MATRAEQWWNNPQLWIEIFVLLNISFLTFDIYLAHSVNQFRNSAEYVPLFFSAAAPVVLVAALALRGRRHWAWTLIGHIVGWSAIAVGLTGVILHLQSQFFYERTIRSLTYSAPFAAPLAYTGLGFLLVMNRMVDVKTAEWARWVLFFALGGFVGNFVFSLTDHAENGFFYRMEWAPVAASALAIGFLVVALLRRTSQGFLAICFAVLACEVGVGVWGFVLHAAANLQGPSLRAFDNFIYGAPPLAPLLFPNLALLGCIGIWRLQNHVVAEPEFLGK